MQCFGCWLSTGNKTKTKFPWMYVAASFVGFLLGTVFQSKQQWIINKKWCCYSNDAATKPTVDSDNDANPNRIRKAVAVNLKQIRKKYQKFNFKTKSDIVSSNSNQNQVVVSLQSTINNHKINHKLAMLQLTNY
jgi:hypothetical protein